MKIFTEKQLVEIQNQVLNKIYQALCKLHERDNSDTTGAVRCRHDELLDLALDVFSKPAEPEHIYPWLRCDSNFNKIFFPKK